MTAPGPSPLPPRSLRLFRRRALDHHLAGEEAVGRLLAPVPAWVEKAFWLLLSVGAVAAVLLLAGGWSRGVA